jgi:chromosome segregation ATPase
VASSDGPFGSDGDEPGGGEAGGDLLDSLRSSGEEVVNQEIAGLQAAMERVESFAANLADSDLDALRSEWQQIESEIKHALRSGLTAVEERTAARHQSTVGDELKQLETEVARKNDLIAQLSDSVKKLNRELDEKDRRLREELRGLRDRVAQQEDELAALRSRGSELDQSSARLRADLDAATSERDGLRQGLTRASEALEVEKAHQDERYAALKEELNEARLAHSRLENEKRDADRRASDLERRLAASDKAREKAEEERNVQAQEAARVGKEARSLGDRVSILDAEVGVQRERIDRDLRRLRRSESQMRADAELVRSRAADVLEALRGAAALLESLPSAAPAEDDEGAPEGGSAG